MDMIFYIFILTALSTLGLWWLWFIQYQKFFIDETRQKLFHIRDKLFLAASNGEISFDEPLYKMTRTNLNGAIRYTHDLSLVRIIGAVVLARSLGETPQFKHYRESWNSAFEQVKSDSAKELIQDAHRKMHLALFHHVVNCSITLRLIIIPVGLCLLIFRKKKIDAAVTSNNTKDQWLAIDVETNMIGAQLSS